MKSNYVRRTRRKAAGHSGSFIKASSANQSFFAPTEKSAEVSPTRTLRAVGEPMAPSVRNFFEASFGTDFSSVRIHRDPEAAESASGLHAQAFTLGEHIVFNRDKYSPETKSGRKLLAHELSHVLQQRSQSPASRVLQMKGEETAPPAEKKKEEKSAAGASSPKANAAETKQKEQAATAEAEKVSQPMTLPDFNTFGKKTVHTDFANNVTFNGKTDATFDGGIGHTKSLKAVPGKDCPNCGAGECVQVTGSLVIDYHVNTTVTLPNVPNGLTPCQEKIVRDAINNKIKPHEDQHVSAFISYNGSVTLPINFNGCKVDLPAHVQAMHDAHAIARENAAKTQSAALDPFNVSVNLDCEDEPPKK